MPKAKAWKTVNRLGQHGRTVKVQRQGDGWRVVARSLGVQQTFRGDGAQEMAAGFADRLVKGLSVQASALPTVGEVWTQYQDSSDFREARPRTQHLTRELIGLFLLVVPPHTKADDVNVLTLEQVRRALETTPRPKAPNGLALSTVQHVIGRVKMMFAWAERVELIHRNRVHAFRFKVGKERRSEPAPEYRREDLLKMLAVCDFDRTVDRTGMVILTLIGHQGARGNAACQLRWEDVLWDEDLIRWRPETDKMGHDTYQPMRRPTRALLSRWHAVQGSPTEGWVFPARQRRAKHPFYTLNSFWLFLKKVEAKAGVPRLKGRAAHGLRRMVAGDLVEATGSDRLAMEAIGDRDPKMAQRYVKRRLDRVKDTLRKLDEGAA